MTGNDKCRSLQEIQKKIAEENGVDMVFEAYDCADPAKERFHVGKRLILALVGLSMLAVMAGCAILR